VTKKIKGNKVELLVLTFLISLTAALLEEQKQDEKRLEIFPSVFMC
jgi:hypothetical protein